jgi:catechol 2,3-dioxygenase-like lactoylglutathione lyase family enzyme
MQAARAFYEGLLDQQVALDLGVNVGYEAGFALWERAHAEPIIYASTPSRHPEGPGRAELELYFEADDVPGAWERLAKAGVEPVHEIREQPWGQLVFRVYDPDHHVVEVGEQMRVVVGRFLGAGLTLEQAAARTGMPVEVVRQIAASLPGLELP